MAEPTRNHSELDCTCPCRSSVASKSLTRTEVNEVTVGAVVHYIICRFPFHANVNHIHKIVQLFFNKLNTRNANNLSFVNKNVKIKITSPFVAN